MRPIHRLFAPLALCMLLAVALSISPAFAEEEPAPPPADQPKAKPKPDPKIPIYSIEYLMPTEDTELEDGWKYKDDEAAGAPTEAQLTNMCKGCKLTEDNFYVELGSLKSEKGTVGFAMVDVEKNVWAYRDRLEAMAEDRGWHVIELASPARLLVVGSGAASEAALAELKAHVVYRFGGLALNRLRVNQAAGRKAAVVYAKALERMAPDSGVLHAVLGLIHFMKAGAKTEDKKKRDKAESNRAIGEWRKAFEKDKSYPVRKGLRVFAAGKLGGLLLEKNDKGLVPAAIVALELAVKHERDGKNNMNRYGNRYNLACAYARMNRRAEALEALRRAIETGETLPVAQWRKSWKHINEKDPDMRPLRSDPIFKNLLADSKPKPDPHAKKKKGKKPKGHP